MAWNNGISGPAVTYTGNNTTAPIATFSWTPSTAKIGTHVFTMNVKDNACDINGVRQYSYTVTVNAPKMQAADPVPGDNFLKCYPQPFTGSITASGFLQGAEGVVTITMVDLTGREVVSFKSLASAGHFTADYDLTPLPAGVYIAEALAGNMRAAMRVLKQ
jgi:hypothetical protein